MTTRDLTEQETDELLRVLASAGPATGVFVDGRLVAIVPPYRDPETVIAAIASSNAR